MIDVLFGDSAAGGLKCSDIYKDPENDAACLGFMADIGDISGSMFSEFRANLMCKMLYQEQWGADPDMEDSLNQLGAHYTSEAARVKRAVLRGEPVRVWVSSAPYSTCGMLWLSGLLAKHKSEVYAVELERFNKENATQTDNTFVIRNSWGECEPKDFVNALSAARRVSQIELAANAMEWHRLKKENSPLRAVIADRVVSVPASFYDFLIWKYLGNKPVNEAILIGKILGENQLGVGDWWYAHRIEHYIKKGKILVIDDNEQKYARVIRRVTRE